MEGRGEILSAFVDTAEDLDHSPLKNLNEISTLTEEIKHHKFEIKASRDKIVLQKKLVKQFQEYRDYLIKDQRERVEKFDETDNQTDFLERIIENIEYYKATVKGNEEHIKTYENKLMKDFSELKKSYAKLSSVLKVNENERQECRICFQVYDTDHKECCISLCGHRFGKSCLEKLQPKRCPLCNKNFVDKHIVILY